MLFDKLWRAWQWKDCPQNWHWDFLGSTYLWHAWFVNTALFIAMTTQPGQTKQRASSTSTCLRSLSFFLSSFCLFSTYSDSTLRDSTLLQLTCCQRHLRYVRLTPVLGLTTSPHTPTDDLLPETPALCMTHTSPWIDHISSDHSEQGHSCNISALQLLSCLLQGHTPTVAWVDGCHPSRRCGQGGRVCIRRALRRATSA